MSGIYYGMSGRSPSLYHYAQPPHWKPVALWLNKCPCLWFWLILGKGVKGGLMANNISHFVFFPMNLSGGWSKKVMLDFPNLDTDSMCLLEPMKTLGGTTLSLKTCFCIVTEACKISQDWKLIIFIPKPNGTQSHPISQAYLKGLNYMNQVWR